MQNLEFVISFGLGIVLCTIAATVLVIHWQLPWREALVWFGLAAYEDRDVHSAARSQRVRATAR